MGFWDDRGISTGTILEAEVILTGSEGQKHSIVTGLEAPCILGIDHLGRGYFRNAKRHLWALGELLWRQKKLRQLNSLLGLSEDSSAVGQLRIEEQQIRMASAAVSYWQRGTNWDCKIPSMR